MGDKAIAPHAGAWMGAVRHGAMGPLEIALPPCKESRHSPREQRPSMEGGCWKLAACRVSGDDGEGYIFPFTITRKD